jgi:uncharacterized protein YrzB (UPF0473 family)
MEENKLNGIDEVSDTDLNEAGEEENVIVLTDEETGEEKEFEIVARCTIDDQLYFALYPVEDEGDEYVILKATIDGEDMVFETVDDDDEFDDVADYFDDLFSEEIDYDAQ